MLDAELSCSPLRALLARQLAPERNCRSIFGASCTTPHAAARLYADLYASAIVLVRLLIWPVEAEQVELPRTMLDGWAVALPGKIGSPASDLEVVI